MKKENGITLVALVITIVIMLILITVTMRLLVNSNIIRRGGKGIKCISNGN